MEDDDDALSPSRSQSQSASRSPSTTSSPPPVSVVPPSSDPSPHVRNGRVAEPVTVAAPPYHALALALSTQQQRPSPAAVVGGGGGGGGGREDCWSEGATSTLIDAWGERFLELSRGNLKQKHWQEVADAVTSRDGYTKTPKTDVQCKNRIDTLKKKYKIEKSKISASDSSTTSSWPFFHRLDLLLGPNHKPTGALPPSSTKIPAGIPVRPPARLTQLIPQRHRSSHPALNKARSLPPSVSSKSADSSADSSDGFPPPPPKEANGKRQRQEPEEGEGEEEEEGRAAGLRELTRAILRFGEVYERVESSKLRQAMEMEKQRMEFTRELELQRLEFFMKTQMELSQLKSHHHHHGSSSNSRKKRMDVAGGGNNHHNHHDTNNNNNSIDNSDNNG
ncbi:trihelix transcription factor ENAP2-like [Musa acuminata AAA Group]|uniref:trihelix transcription factor ENAP2-like n=1 Tax=Musa acuminata AAA Group TaxID=214697 RepID=UPI0031E445B3